MDEKTSASEIDFPSGQYVGGCEPPGRLCAGQVWLDYKSLVPAKPWADQIENGIAEADTVLLVVSQAALASKYVEMEWEQAIEPGKRIVLVLF